MDGPSRRLENNTESNMGFKNPDQGVSEENNVSNWPRDHSCGILAKKETTFCLCPKNLCEVKLKSNGHVSLTTEISR